MLYEKYRPAKFEDMVGQEDTSSILKNQIKTDNVAHSYLFCGTRGTGKTTSARIVAKAVNCEHPTNGEPCGECAMCKSIDSGKSMDVIELDAASNNGVDDIREIINQMKYAPAQGKKKIFIIDECHMLSKSAMNAFLKALEEPPAHVIFILATTDPQNLPVTIISRCQRFDFKRIQVNKITERLRFISGNEKVTIDFEILNLIAKSSDGAMRDAISILEKVISIDEINRNKENIAKLLSMTGFEVISKLINSIVNGVVFNSLNILNQLDNEGQDFGLFIKDLIKYVRNLMILSADGPEEIIAATQEDIAVMKQIVANTTSEKIIDILDLLQAAENNIKWNGNAKVALETVAIKANQNKQKNKEIEELKCMLSSLQHQFKNSNLVSDSKPEQQRPEQMQDNKPNTENTQQNIQQTNPVVLAKRQIIEISRQYNKVDFADALSNSKMFMQQNILLFQTKNEEEKEILEKNKTNLTNGFSKYLEMDIVVEIK